MPTRHPLLDVTEIDSDIETYLQQIGEITYRFPEHDSRCQSFRAVVDNQRWFVKHGNTPQTITWLKQAVRFHAAVQHEALPRLHNTFVTSDGFALVYNWVDGEGLRPERELVPMKSTRVTGFVRCPHLKLLMHSTSSLMSIFLSKKEGSSLKTFTMAALFMTLRKSADTSVRFRSLPSGTVHKRPRAIVRLKSIHGTGRISERRAHRRKNKRLYVRAYSVRVACQQQRFTGRLERE